MPPRHLTHPEQVTFEFEDQDVWQNMAVMVGMMLIYRGAAMLWSYIFHHGKK